MSEENVELVHRAYAALQAGDIEEFLAYVAPDASGIRSSRSGAAGGPRRRARVVGRSPPDFPDWKPSIVTARGVGEHVIVHARGVGTGAASGVGIDQNFWRVAKIEGDQIVWYCGVRSEQKALEVAGLSE